MGDDMKYVMFEHAGSGNHGCEAIVRSTQKILGDSEYYLQSFTWNEDIRYGISDKVRPIILQNKIVERNSVNGIIMRAQSRINPSIDYDTRESIYRNKDLLIRNSVALSIGGDNYCYAGIINSMRDKLRAFRAKSIPTVLWGCSIDHTYLDKYTINDLNGYNLITARESCTMEILDGVGIRDNIVGCADPAFILESQYVDYRKEIFDEKEVIGINVSDFVKYYNSYPNATYQNFYRLLEYILKNTNCYIALIPHVRQVGNDDLEPIKNLYAMFDNERIICVEEDLNCMQLKYLISKCCAFIGCRTHSTIAAYSTCVPTLVAGYSIKAKGICKDIFGTYDDLLVDVRSFKNDYDLTKKFVSFWERRDELQKKLRETIPEYCQRAYNGKIALDKLNRSL